MAFNLLTFLGNVALMLAAVWLLLALVGLKFRSFKTLRRAYTGCLLHLGSVVATWLWLTPRIQQEGGGRIADPYFQYPAELPVEAGPEEVDQWP